MRITLLGTGTPVNDPQRQLSGLLIEAGEDRLLFDTGRGVTGQLLKAGLLPQQVQPVFITHHHYDHIGNLGDFLLTAWHNGRTAPLDVYGPPGTAAIVTTLLTQVYARDIAFARFFNGEGPDILELVRAHDVFPGLVCDQGQWRVLAEAVDHGNSAGLAWEVWPCLGYRVEAAGKVVVISGDSIACEGLDRLAQDADLLVQCCYLAEAEITHPAAERSAKQIIASSGQAGQIAARNRVKRLVLTHIRPKAEALLQAMLEDVRRAYAGPIHLGQDLMVIEV
jgi:ribonuclease Z